MTYKVVSEYFAALERLKQNKPKRIPRGSAINKDNVAKEAGRARGSVRNRPGFESLLKAIEDAQFASTKGRTLLDDKQRIERRNAKIEVLMQENEKLKARYMSLLFLNYEMAQKLRKAGIEHPQLGQAVEFEIEDRVPF